VPTYHAGNARYKAEDPPHETLLLRARGSAVAYDAKGLMHNSGIKIIKRPPQSFVKKGRDDEGADGADDDDDDDEEDDNDGGESQQDSFADVPGVLETESIAAASLEPMAAALDDDNHSYYVPANEVRVKLGDWGYCRGMISVFSLSLPLCRHIITHDLHSHLLPPIPLFLCFFPLLKRVLVLKTCW